MVLWLLWRVLPARPAQTFCPTSRRLLPMFEAGDMEERACPIQIDGLRNVVRNGPELGCDVHPGVRLDCCWPKLPPASSLQPAWMCYISPGLTEAGASKSYNLFNPLYSNARNCLPSPSSFSTTHPISTNCDLLTPFATCSEQQRRMRRRCRHGWQCCRHWRACCLASTPL